MEPRPRTPRPSQMNATPATHPPIVRSEEAWRELAARYRVPREEVVRWSSVAGGAEPAAERSDRVERLRQQVARGAYRVDAAALADALLGAGGAGRRQPAGAANAPGEPSPQHWTLYPSVQGLDDEEEEAPLSEVRPSRDRQR